MTLYLNKDKQHYILEDENATYRVLINKSNSLERVLNVYGEIIKAVIN